MKRFTSKTQILGEKGEDSACEFLVAQGFTILERNVSNKYGEIDIVAKRGNITYFFEVKAGKQGSWFNPAENLTKTKLRKLLISTEHYALTHGIRDYRVQGVIVLLPQIESGEVKIEMIEIY